jgi:SnoaL-like domain
MAGEDDKGVVQAFVDAINLGDHARIEALLTPDALFRAPTGEVRHGPEAIGDWFEKWHAAFPHYHLTVSTAEITQGAVALKGQATGTHRGDLHLPSSTIPATGEPVALAAQILCTVRGGKISAFAMDTGRTPVSVGPGQVVNHPVTPHHLRLLYRLHFADPRRERVFVASLSFVAAFATVRFIVRSIQGGRGPFRNVSAGGRHIHHLVWGILLLLGIGYLWLIQIGTGVGDTRRWMRATATLYGIGSALTLDEFALWLNLSDVYFTPEGRESIDAVILFAGLLSSGLWGAPFFKAFVRLVVLQGKATAQR